jgi:hypothetical protein
MKLGIMRRLQVALDSRTRPVLFPKMKPIKSDATSSSLPSSCRIAGSVIAHTAASGTCQEPMRAHCVPETHQASLPLPSFHQPIMQLMLTAELPMCKVPSSILLILEFMYRLKFKSLALFGTLVYINQQAKIFINFLNPLHHAS